MPRKRILSPATVASALEDMRRARAACVRISAEAPIHGPHYAAAHEVMQAIDGFAQVATGSLDHFHTRMCPVENGPKG